MALTPVQGYSEIRGAFDRLAAHWADGATPYTRRSGWQGGSGTYIVQWRADHRLWGRLAAQDQVQRYDCAFGQDDPARVDMLSMTCKISFPYAGINRRVAGLIAEDTSGEVYLCHSGRFAARGAGLSAGPFLQWNRDRQRELVRWPDGRQSEVVVVTRLLDRNLAAELARFVRSVADYKQESARG